MSAEDWHLPPDYCLECQPNGSFVLFRDDLRVRAFPSSTRQRAIEAWCDAFETGCQVGLKEGIARGRNELATQLRQLLQLP